MAHLWCPPFSRWWCWEWGWLWPRPDHAKWERESECDMTVADWRYGSKWINSSSLGGGWSDGRSVDEARQDKRQVKLSIDQIVCRSIDGRYADQMSIVISRVYSKWKLHANLMEWNGTNYRWFVGNGNYYNIYYQAPTQTTFQRKSPPTHRPSTSTSPPYAPQNCNNSNFMLKTK